MTGTQPHAEPFFLAGRAGRLFCHYYPGVSIPRRDVVVVPPFAEEMNRSRRMLALLAQALAARGVGTLLIDLYGTGDSEGDFSEARWDIWRDDISTGLSWLREHGALQISVLGVRLGGALALDVLRKCEGQCETVVLWQPVVNGELFMTQFLRVRLAASMLDRAKERESTGELRAQLVHGDLVEVAGYEVAPALAASIDAVRLEQLATTHLPPVHWFDLTTTEGSMPAPATERVLHVWRRQGINVSFGGIVGVPFWSTQEITLVPALLEATVGIWPGRLP